MKSSGNFRIYFCYFYAVSFNATQGACRNQNGQYNDIFSDLLTLDECKSMCASAVGCGAVSYNEVTLDCYGTSMIATTTSESAWNCYSKTGYNQCTYNIGNQLKLF